MGLLGRNNVEALKKHFHCLKQQAFHYPQGHNCITVRRILNTVCSFTQQECQLCQYK